MKKPLIFAHRAIDWWNGDPAKIDGVDFIELDVRKTADGILVVSRYRSVKNAIRRVLIDQNSYQDLYDMTGRKLPLLEEVVEELKNDILFNLDLKQPDLFVELRRFVKRHSLESNILVDSTNSEVLERLHRVFPSARYAFTFTKSDKRDLWGYRFIRGITYFSYFALYPMWPRLIKFWAKKTPFVPAASIYYRSVNSGVIRFFHDRELPVYVWPVNNEADMKKMIQLGVDGIKTRKPGLLQEIVNGKR